MNRHPSHTLVERLEALAAFLPHFEQPGFEFGTWVEPTTREPGVWTMPFFAYSDVAGAFFDMTYEQGWVLSDFDWPAWQGTAEAIALRDDTKTLAKATPEQLAQLLTVLVRQDRFSEGSLASAYASGLLTSIVRRAARLADELGVEGDRQH